jgi:hypothetical protein
LQALEFAHFQVMGSLVDQWRQMGQLFWKLGSSHSLWDVPT